MTKVISTLLVNSLKFSGFKEGDLDSRLYLYSTGLSK